MATIKYRPEIDGLRAVAIIPVIFFNMGFQWAAGGFIGVDVFFVISGYLITSIILTDQDKGTFSFLSFWLKRILRIFPSLLVMLIIASIAGYFILFGSEINDLGLQGISAALLFANITMWKLAGNYWGAHVNNSLFLHTWALSLIEQFYIVYPFVLILLLKFARKWLLSATLILGIVSFLLYLWGSQYHPTATFYLLPSRMWELISGGLVAILTWKYNLKISSPISSLLSVLGFTLIILSYFLVTGQNEFKDYAIIPIIGSALVIAVTDNRSIINKILSWTPVAYIGRISFALYLWHWPIFILARQAKFRDICDIPTFVIIFLILTVSLASYYLVEKTTRYKTRTPLFICFALIISLALSISLYAGNHSYDTSSYSKAVWKGQLYNLSPVDTWPDAVKKRMEGIEVTKRKDFNKNDYAAGGIIKIYGGSKPEILVIGDSEALMWADVIDNIAQELRITVAFYAADATSPFVQIPLDKSKGSFYFNPEEKYLFDSKRLEIIQKWKPKIVIIAVGWSYYSGLEFKDDLVRFIGDTSSKILLIEQPPILYFGDKNAIQFLSFIGLIPRDNKKQYIRINKEHEHEYESGRKLMRSLSKKYPYCDYIPVADIFYQEKDLAWVLDGSHVLYIDDDHLSQDGAMKAKVMIKNKIKDAIYL
jgi:peptidoglycan/LPS O-acetylase OafA/YrhL